MSRHQLFTARRRSITPHQPIIRQRIMPPSTITGHHFIIRLDVFVPGRSTTPTITHFSGPMSDFESGVLITMAGETAIGGGNRSGY